MLHIKWSQPSSLEPDMTLIIFAWLWLFLLLLVILDSFKNSFYYLHFLNSTGKSHPAENSQASLSPGDVVPQELLPCWGQQSCWWQLCKAPSGAPQPTEDKGLVKDGGGELPYANAWAIFDSHSKASKNSVCRILCHMEELWFGLFPSCISLSKKGKKKGRTFFSSVQMSPQSSSSSEGQFIAGAWKTKSEQKGAVRIQVPEDRALSNSKVFFCKSFIL